MRMGDRRQTYAGAGCAQAGGSVVVWKLDRLGRNTLHILATVKLLTERGVTLVSTTDGIDSSTAAGRMVIGVLASVAEFERELAKQRTALKRATSRTNGTKFGRPRKVDDSEHIATAKRMRGQRPHRQRHRQVPRGEPGDALSIPCGLTGPTVLAIRPSRCRSMPLDAANSTRYFADWWKPMWSSVRGAGRRMPG
jgi:Resolvase, N terminal domain